MSNYVYNLVEGQNFFLRKKQAETPKGEEKKKIHSALKRGTSLPRDSNKRVKRQDRQGERVSAVDNPQTSIRNMEEIFICQLGKKNTIAGKKKTGTRLKASCKMEFVVYFRRTRFSLFSGVNEII